MTGVGKTWVASALAQQACRLGYSARYVRLPRLLPELALARADGRYPKLLRDYAKTQFLILDDWGLAPLTADGRRDLLELLDDRYNRQSTVVTSQLPVAAWHAYLNEPTLADAILDRLVHNAYTRVANRLSHLIHHRRARSRCMWCCQAIHCMAGVCRSFVGAPPPPPRIA